MAPEIRTMADVAAFMNERCLGCGCLLNNAPECSERCSHAEGKSCPPECWDHRHPNQAMRRPPEGADD